MGYITVTCHCITSDWHMQSAILATLHVAESHTSLNLTSQLKKVTKVLLLLLLLLIYIPHSLPLFRDSPCSNGAIIRYTHQMITTIAKTHTKNYTLN